MSEEKSLSPAVNRAVLILDALRDEPRLSMSEISRRVGLPKSSIANILGAMDQTGLIERSNQTYTLGRRLVEFGASYLTEHSTVAMFQSGARQLEVAGKETVVFAELVGSDILYLARHYGTQPIRLTNDIGNRMPAAATALGQAMLSVLPDDELDELLSGLGELPQLTKKSYKDVEQLREALVLAAERGYAVDDELNTEGVICFAVPLPLRSEFDSRYAVSVTMLKARHTKKLEKQLVSDLLDLVRMMPTI